MEKHTGFIYIWYDRKKKWFCIGSRFGTTNDGYITSTGWMSRAYKKRPEDFRRRILEYYYGTDRKELLQLEQKWLDMIKDSELCVTANSESVRYYNMKKKATGLSGPITTEIRKKYWASDKGQEHKKRLSEEAHKRNAARKGTGTIPWNKGKKCPTISKAKKGQPTGFAWNKGKKCPEISKGRRANPTVYTEEMRKAIGDFHRGRKRSDETKRKQSAALLGRSKTDEHKKNLSKSAKERSKRLLTCPHCNFVGNGPAMNRWHFKNCKIANA